jgi:hypothetical protein
MTPEERRTMDRIRQPMSPIIQQMILQKERERSMLGEARQPMVVQEYSAETESKSAV